jgi:mannosyl-3-phosphoglycerate phosphatase
MTRLVVFTDLDGTLLAHDDYDWTEAAPAIRALRERYIPLVFTSSKTRREIEAWRARIGNDDPFISENGGALYVPRGALPTAPAGATAVNDYWRLELGPPYAALRTALAGLGAGLGVGLRGFGDMAADEITRRTGLAPEDVALAAAREYDEPFVPVRPLGEDEERLLAEEAGRLGFRITRGGRFHHLLGPASKAEAARRLLAAYGTDVTSVAVGDSANDLELLAAADQPIVVARPDGTHSPELRWGVPRAMFTRGIGPAGFAEGVLGFLEGWRAGATAPSPG